MLLKRILLLAASSLLVISFSSVADKTQCTYDAAKCKEENGIKEFALKNKLTFDEAKVAMMIATKDLAIHNCNLPKDELYEKFKAKMFLNENLKKASQNYYSDIKCINVYSMENWCHDYAYDDRIFGLW